VSDVAALLLSSGEPYVHRARRSLDAQTCRLDEVVLIENVSPFHRAFAQGVSRVRSPFFVQVDADMVLDPGCVAALRSAMEDGVGVVCGNLRDPLSGQVEGVKLFRTNAAKKASHSNTVSSETDFVNSMERDGWRLKYIGRVAVDSNASPETYGDHLPEYSVHYTFQKFLVEGRKYRFRGARAGLFSKLQSLGQTRHEMTPLARLALAHGFFLADDHDLHEPARPDARADSTATLLANDGTRPDVTATLFPLARHDTLRQLFRAFVSSGVALAEAGAGATVREILGKLAGEPRGWHAVVASLGFGHGVVARSLDDMADDEQKLRAFIFLGIGRPLSLVRHARARLERLYYRLPKPLAPGRVVPFWRKVPRW
jgi:hypothetical protein